MLISILVYSFHSAANLATSYDTNVADGALQRFNDNFVKNSSGGTVEIQDIITMVHFAKDYNTRNGYEKGSSQYITVKLNNKELTDKTDEDLIEVMTNNTFVKNNDNTENKERLQQYECEITYDEEGRVNEVICKAFDEK